MPRAAPETTLTGVPALSADPTVDPVVTVDVLMFEFESNQTGATFECDFNDSATWVPCTSPETIENVEDGEYSFAVRARNASTGLFDETPAEWDGDIMVGPVVSIVGIPNSPTTAADPQGFYFTATDNTSPAADILYFECRVDGGAWEACGTPAVDPNTGEPVLTDTGVQVMAHEYTGPSAGAHTFEVRATDGAQLVGNVSAEPAEHTRTIEP